MDAEANVVLSEIERALADALVLMFDRERPTGEAGVVVSFARTLAGLTRDRDARMTEVYRKVVRIGLLLEVDHQSAAEEAVVLHRDVERMCRAG